MSNASTVVRVKRGFVIGLFAVGFLLAYVLGGQFLHDLAEGQQRDILPFWKIVVPFLTLVAAVVAGFARWRGGGETGAALESVPVQGGSSRRVFLRSLGGVGTGLVSVAGGLGLAVYRNKGWLPVANDFFVKDNADDQIAPTFRDEWKGSQVAKRRRLGRTNEMVSDISLGAGRINDVGVARHALDAGINYFDTAPDYSDTLSEQVLGEAMKGRRDEVFLATKFCRRNGHLHNDTPVPEIIGAVEQSLKRLQTDHVDLIHIHSCDRIERLMDENIHEAFDRLKEQGKVRFLGVSTHTPNLEEVANAAIDSNRFDVMMLAYHYGMWPSFGHILEKAKANDVGVVAMKTLRGARHETLEGFRDEAASYAQSAFRWVLSNPAVACLVISIYEHRQIDEYLYASGTALRDSDVAVLDKYDRLVRGDYCQPHCGECLGSCPDQLAIHDILRYRMYFKDYRNEKEAMRLYAKLERDAARCAGCTAPCESHCPTGVDIQRNMLDAHARLRLTV